MRVTTGLESDNCRKKATQEEVFQFLWGATLGLNLELANAWCHEKLTLHKSEKRRRGLEPTHIKIFISNNSISPSTLFHIYYPMKNISLTFDRFLHHFMMFSNSPAIAYDRPSIRCMSRTIGFTNVHSSDITRAAPLLKSNRILVFDYREERTTAPRIESRESLGLPRYAGRLSTHSLMTYKRFAKRVRKRGYFIACASKFSQNGGDVDVRRTNMTQRAARRKNQTHIESLAAAQRAYNRQEVERRRANFSDTFNSTSNTITLGSGGTTANSVYNFEWTAITEEAVNATMTIETLADTAGQIQGFDEWVIDEADDLRLAT
jgi:hypothetical protein